MEEYGNYWYSNLVKYTEDTYNYVIRMAIKNGFVAEKQHKFYENGRNPRVFSPNIDLLDTFRSKYKLVYETKLDEPERLLSQIINLYEMPIRKLKMILSDEKSSHKIDKLSSLYNKSKMTNVEEKTLDMLNISEVAVLKIREFQSFLKHNISSYEASKILSELVLNATEFSKNLFRTIFSGLKETAPNDIVVKGYASMRKFIFKI